MKIKSPLSFFEAEFWFASLVSDCHLSDLSLKDWRGNYLCSCLYFQMVAQQNLNMVLEEIYFHV